MVVPARARAGLVALHAGGDRLPLRPWMGERGWFVSLSVADLNGPAFWLTPLGRGR